MKWYTSICWQQQSSSSWSIRSISSTSSRRALLSLSMRQIQRIGWIPFRLLQLCSLSSFRYLTPHCQASTSSAYSPPLSSSPYGLRSSIGYVYSRRRHSISAWSQRPSEILGTLWSSMLCHLLPLAVPCTCFSWTSSLDKLTSSRQSPATSSSTRFTISTWCQLESLQWMASKNIQRWRFATYSSSLPRSSPN